MEVGIHAGYTLLGQSIDNRTTTIVSTGDKVSNGTAHDGLLFNGFLAGVDGQYRTRGEWPLTLRVGIGVFIGSVRDHRSGPFTTSRGLPFTVDVTQDPFAGYLDIAPEIRIGRKFGDHFELNVGVAAHILASVASTPRWATDAAHQITTGVDVPGCVVGGNPPCLADGQGTFNNDTVAGSVLIVLVPGVGLKYEF